jgi:P4 family phage/plasmid primase-like protien
MSVLRDFLSALHPSDYHYLASFKPRTDTALLRDPSEAEEFVARHEGRDVYIGVAGRDGEGRDLEHCTTLHVLFAEVDFKDTPELVARTRLAEFPLPPSMVISSGGGLHLYWLLEEPIDLRSTGPEQVTEYLRALARRLGADVRAAEPARVLRLPDTLNTKYSPPRKVLVEAWRPGLRTGLFDLLSHCPMEEQTDEAGTRRRISDPLPDTAGEGTRNDVLFREACRLRRLGFEQTEILAAIREVNRRRCRPPLSEGEVMEISRGAARYKPAEDLFPLTETGDSEFFAACFGDLVRFDWRRGRWLLFNSVRWAPQASGEIDRLALEAIRARQRAAEGSKEKLHWAAGGEARRRRSNLIALAQSVEKLADTGEGWDSDPWLLCAPNGIIDLRTGELRAGRPEDRITMMAAYRYNPEARCPLWEATVADIFEGEPEKAAYIHRALGYSITGDCREEVFFLLTGELDSPDKSGRNGKGTLINTVARVLGDYSDNLAFHSLEQSGHGPKQKTNDIAKLSGKRFVTASEASGGRFDEARVKALTGRDPITAAFHYKEEFTFVPEFKLWLSVNAPPKVRDESSGFWSRPHVLIFRKTYAGREDKSLKDRLLEEGEGILAWLVRGAVEWARDGLRPPDEVRMAVEQYRSQEDRLSTFYEDPGLLFGEGLRTSSAQLHEWYMEWARRTRHHATLSLRRFSQAVARRLGPARMMRFGDRTLQGFDGIGLTEEATRVLRHREEVEL